MKESLPGKEGRSAEELKQENTAKGVVSFPENRKGQHMLK